LASQGVTVALEDLLPIRPLFTADRSSYRYPLQAMKKTKTQSAIQSDLQHFELQEIAQLAKAANVSRSRQHRDRNTIEVDRLALDKLSAALCLYEDAHGTLSPETLAQTLPKS